MGAPRGEENLPELLVEVASVGHEGGRQKDVSADGGHLGFECFAANIPSLSLVAEAQQESLATVHLTMSVACVVKM